MSFISPLTFVRVFHMYISACSVRVVAFENCSVSVSRKKNKPNKSVWPAVQYQALTQQMTFTVHLMFFVVVFLANAL